MTEDLRDLIDRLEGARDSLAALAADTDGANRARLEAKRQGVLLALSYAREAQR